MKNTNTTDTTIGNAGTVIANAAMRLLAAHPKAKTASVETLDAAIAAMKAAIPSILDEMFADMKAAPSVANYATQAAVLSLAQAGMAKL